MSSANPVETKVETAAKVVDAAAALAGPTPPVAEAATKAGFWAFRNPKRFGIVAGSTAIALAAGTFGWKYFLPPSKSAHAQDDKTVAQAKPDEFVKPSEHPTPPKRTEDPLMLELPPVPGPKPSPTAKPDRVEIEMPVITAPKPTPRPAETEPPLILPPAPKPDPMKPGPDPDNLFKAPDPLPSTVTDRKDKPADKEAMPVIRIGASADVTPPAPMPKKPTVDVPPPPLIVDVPPPLPTPKPTDVPKLTDVAAPPVPMAPKIEDVPPIVSPPVIGPSPKVDAPPVVSPPVIGPSPTVDAPPIVIPMKDKMIEAPPLIPIGDPPPVIKSPMIPDAPVGVSPPVKPEKKDMYDEDWHAQREGDTYAIISKEYYKTVDYSAALEAYNKERKKSGERIVRVPPTWVLEEQFPNLVGTKPEKSSVPTAIPTGNPKFEPIPPKNSGERPAPLPSPASSSDEYKVKAEAGETIREIARKIYGDPNGWKKLYDLNPTLDPTQPIPSGTTLRLGK